MIEKLRYVRLGVTDPAAMNDFVTRIVGLQPIESPDGLSLYRSDNRDHSLVVYPADRNEQTLALEVRDTRTLDEAVSRLEGAGYSVSRGSDEEAAARRCKTFAHFSIRGVVRIELVVRPRDTGWRYFGTRDAGIVEFFGVTFASTDPESDIKLWTGILGGKVADYIGEGAYIALDDQHHRITILPSDHDGLLEIQYKVEALHQLMQNSYYLQSAQVGVAHGPGRRPASGEAFLSFRSPDSVLFCYTAEGEERPLAEDYLPRQFPHAPQSYCAWGSVANIPEYCG
ncbi:VOC family protein [Hoeflea sp. WL0058]|uniref:VOC family protein n=1 Tax=Flavimaribacter sediminis TaxID=2865987 RepID=A0AAE2ZPB1_9HYPH|nr:VOC family protein [Flavimaribacter sediminis]MBW8638445.1 VOC family protein [Flavimaribacter sediminis]